MASGTLGQIAPTENTNTTAYTVPVSKIAIFNISVCNTTSSSAMIRLAIATSTTPSIAEWIEYDVVLPAKGVLERGGLIASAGKLIVVYSTVASVSFNVYGYEE